VRVQQEDGGVGRALDLQLLKEVTGKASPKFDTRIVVTKRKARGGPNGREDLVGVFLPLLAGSRVGLRGRQKQEERQR
jgi:hypothetical protein